MYISNTVSIARLIFTCKIITDILLYTGYIELWVYTFAPEDILLVLTLPSNTIAVQSSLEELYTEQRGWWWDVVYSRVYAFGLWPTKSWFKGLRKYSIACNMPIITG